MKSLKDKMNNSRLLAALKNKYLIVTVLFLLWIVFFDNNNLISWYKELSTLAQQNRQKQYYKEAIIKTDEKLKELSSNKDSLERFAREQFLFHEQGEEVYVVEDDKNSGK
ncbi:MAG: septum formation initiator family protein [Bacteroidales bacterium]|nr:septum formation initiator family protein [Bacteroidales bacterium]